jgi:hypothetical protein
LDRKVRWLLAFEDAVDIAGRAPVHVDPIRPIGDQAAADHARAVIALLSARWSRRRLFIGFARFDALLGTYGDGVSDVDIRALVAFHKGHGA